MRCAAASASPGADERGWALAWPACRAWFLRCPGLSSSTGYGGGSSFTPPPDLKLSSRFFFFSCDQAKKKERKKTKPGSSNIIRFVVVDSTAQYSRKKAIDFASRTYGSAYLTAKNAIASQHIKTAKFFKQSPPLFFLSGGEKQTSVVSACAKRQKKKRKTE